MLHIKKRRQDSYGGNHFYVDIISSEDMIKRGDIYIWQGYALQILDTDGILAIISWLRGCELNWADWNDSIGWTKFTNNPVESTDNTHMPTSVGPGYQGKVRTTVTRHPDDPSKIISLHTKFLPMANYYNTSAVLKTANEKETKESVKSGSYEVLKFQVRLGLSEESVKLQMVRELHDTVDVDDVQFLISEIF